MINPVLPLISQHAGEADLMNYSYQHFLSFSIWQVIYGEKWDIKKVTMAAKTMWSKLNQFLVQPNI